MRRSSEQITHCLRAPAAPWLTTSSAGRTGEREESKMSLNVMLTPNRVDAFTRPEAYGTPAYFGKVEWFDVVDRETNELLPWTVSRVDGGECIVNRDGGGVWAGLVSLNSAAELIHGQRMPEVRARKR